MSYLLDTCVALWWLEGRPLSRKAQEAISDPRRIICLSAASVWEISVKHAKGALPLPKGFYDALDREKFSPLPITAEHARAAGELPPHHRDPFDRMLIAQAQCEGLTLVTRDKQFEQYEVTVLAA